MIKRIALIGTAVLLVSAAPESSHELIREGNLAFDQGHHTQAVELYNLAQRQALDPGLTAFNQGVSLYRQGEFAAAEQEFRRSLDDRAAPAERRARALYNLGNCLLRLANPDELRRLRTAIACFQDALDLVGDDPTFRGDVRHNLEMSKVLWARAVARAEDPPAPNEEPRADPEPRTDRPNEPDQGSRSDPGTEPQPGGQPNPGEAQSPREIPSDHQGAQDAARSTPGKGELPVLPDDDRLTPLTPDQATEHLLLAVERLGRERRARSRTGTETTHPDIKNW